MKKLSLLVALGLFTLGTATVVKAGPEKTDDVMIDSPDAAVEVDQDGVVEAATEEIPATEEGEAANLEEGIIPVEDVPTEMVPDAEPAQ